MLDTATNLKSLLKDPSLLMARALVAGDWVEADDGKTFVGFGAGFVSSPPYFLIVPASRWAGTATKDTS